MGHSPVWRSMVGRQYILVNKRQCLSTFSTIEIWDENIICCEVGPVHCRLFHRISDFYLSEVNNTILFKLQQKCKCLLTQSCVFWTQNDYLLGTCFRKCHVSHSAWYTLISIFHLLCDNRVLNFSWPCQIFLQLSTVIILRF